MFSKHKEKQAEEQYQVQLSAWQAHQDELLAVLAAAEGRQGSTSTEIMLKRGEAVFASIGNVSLVEMRAGPGHYEGHSSGVSIPIGPIRYRVGASRGHFVQGTPGPRAVDIGKLFVTNQRIIFRGASKSSECLFTKILGINQNGGVLNVSVSNRQKATVVDYGADLDHWLQLRLALALAIFRGEASQFEGELRARLGELNESKPLRPTLAK